MKVVSMERLLVVDDDRELCQLVTRFLTREGFEISWAFGGEAGVERALAEDFSLIMLDVMMPDTDGFDVLRRIRQRCRTPVLMLTARGDTHDRILGLEMGADDYLPKPFDPAELVARIRAILRRSAPRKPVSAAIALGDIELDGGARTVRRSGEQVDLTTVEFDLLVRLLGAAGSTVSRGGPGERCVGARFFSLRPQHRHARLQSAAEAGSAGRWRRAHQGRSRSGLSLRFARETGVQVRRLFITIFLWFWLTLIAVALILALFVVHAGFGFRQLVRLSLHDLLLFTLAGGIFCYLISRYLTEPLHKLGEAAKNIAEGRLDTRVDPSLIRRRDEIADLARNFDVMAERIEALITGQRRLLGDVSHELRSPLSRLIVALSLVKQGPAEEVAENLDRIALEARRLDTLIGQLLTLTRIDSGVDRGSPAPFDLANLVQEVANDGNFEARARNRSVRIKQADSCTVEGFEELLRSAVENVVRNAIRHTAEGSTVEISVHSRDSRAVIEVRDYGPGVPEGMLSEIFLPFRRVANGESDGAGLGLAIAERAVNVHRGELRARNAAEGGLIVEINLPRRSALPPV
jgi:DNA-binding response OmpR family regulator/signal transduction histidine kinase